jgi:tRNA(fMet)-specific endonuclease VapC
MELEYGVERSTQPEAMRRDVDGLLNLLTVKDFDRSAARHASEIRAILANQGTPIGPLDTLIAGHARSLGLVVVTHNLREFCRVPDLQSEDWLVS